LVAARIIAIERRVRVMLDSAISTSLSDESETSLRVTQLEETRANRFAARLRPFDRDDAGNALELTHDALQLSEIGTNKAEGVRRSTIIASATRSFTDVDALLVKGLSDRRENARTIGSHDAKLNRTIDFRSRVP
jgi:hypothetical protein